MKRTKQILSVFLSFCMIISCMVGMSLTTYATPTEFTILQEGDVLHLGDTINSTTGYQLGGGSLLNTNLKPWTLVRGNIIDSMTITESENGDYYLLKSNDGTVFKGAQENLFGYTGGLWSVTDNSDGISVESLNGSNVTFAVHEASAHTHSFTYSATGATITATCTAGCPDSYDTTPATLTIAAAGGTYDGTTAYSATVTNNIPAVTGDTVGDVAYYKVDTQGATTGGTVQTGAPTGAGYYYASVTLTSGSNTYTAVKAFTVAKIDPTAPTGLNATYGQTLSDVVLPTGWTWTDSTQSVGSVGNNTFKANFAGDDNHSSASNVDVTVTVDKAANPATVTGTASVTKGSTVDLSANVTKNGATGAVSYAIDGNANGCTLNGSVLTSGSTTGTVTVNVTIAEDDNYNALAATPITVTISDKATQTITAADVIATYGDTGKAVSATLTTGDGTLSYAVTAGDDVVTINATSGALTILKVGSATVTVTASATDTYAETTKTVAITINPTDPTTPTGLTATEGQTLADVALPTGWTWDSPTTSVGTAGTHTFPASYTETTGNYKHPTAVALTVTVKAKPAETYSVTVVGGTSDKATAEAGATVTITATIPDGKEFVNWTTSDVEGLNGSTAATTTFTMPAKAVTVTANFKDKSSGGGQGGGGYTPVIPSYTPTTTTTTTNTGKLDNTTDEKKNDNGASLESSNDELSKAVLTDADRDAMAKGENIQVYLEVEEKKPTKAEQQKAEEALAKIDEGGEIAMYMDMNLFKKVGSKAPVQIHEVNGKVEVGFKVPEKFINSDPDTQRTFYIGHIKDDGTVEIIKCEFDPETGIATFYTDSFSCYFLIFEDAPAAADTSVGETDDDEDTDTDTGDDFDELTDDSDDDDDEEDTDGTISDDDSDDADDDHSVDNAVDDGNPHTGVSAGFGLLAVCALTAGAALVLKKRKK